MAIERDLHDLLFDHDCVIVPEWGGFLTHYRPARLDEGRRLVHPPAKEVSFNRHLVRNDGLLADRMARRENMEFDAATARIETEVATWRQRLDREGRVELAHIGVFYRDVERNLQFDTDHRANFLKEAYGLRPLAAVPVERVRPAPVVVQMPVLPPAPPPKKVEEVEERRATWVWAAAAMAAVVFGAAAVWAYRSGSASDGPWAGISPFAKTPERTYSRPSDIASAPVATAGVFVLPEGPLGIRAVPLTMNDSVLLTVDLGSPEAPVMKPDSVAVRAPKAVTPIPNATRNRFHVIGGCFAQPENADKFLGDLVAKGYPASLLKRSGELHPVAFGSYARREEALEALALARTNGYPSAWLLVR